MEKDREQPERPHSPPKLGRQQRRLLALLHQNQGIDISRKKIIEQLGLNGNNHADQIISRLTHIPPKQIEEAGYESGKIVINRGFGIRLEHKKKGR